MNDPQLSVIVIIGYLCGAGDVTATLTDMEFHWARYLTAAYRRAFEDLPA
jgi:hypothetical protein